MVLKEWYAEAYAEAYAEGYAEGKLLGAVAEARKIIRIVGDDKFGPPDAQTAAAIRGIKGLARLEDLGHRLLTVRNWQELLGQPAVNLRRRCR